MRKHLSEPYNKRLGRKRSEVFVELFNFLDAHERHEMRKATNVSNVCMNSIDVGASLYMFRQEPRGRRGIQIPWAFSSSFRIQ